MKSISLCREIHYGAGALEKVRLLEGRCRTALIVTDKTLVAVGLLKRLTDLLDSLSIRYTVFDDVGPNPTRSTVFRCLKKVEEEGLTPDWVIGFGGGSPIDTAKAVRVFLEYPDISWDDLIDPSAIPPLGKNCKFLAISTTSGTGSEVSFGSVISNDSLNPPIKESIVHPEIIPDLAIADPELVLGMPPELTAATGFDALVHAIESFTAKGANEFSAPLSLQATKMIFQQLRNAYRNGRDLQARDAIHTAQMLAGIAFTNAGLGIAHSMGHQLTSYYGLPHGVACGIMLPYVVLFNSRVIADKYAEIARALGLQCHDAMDGVKQLVSALNQLQEDVGIPVTIGRAGVARQQFEQDLKAMVHYAISDQGLMQVTPLPPTVAEMEAIYRNAYDGVLE